MRKNKIMILKTQTINSGYSSEFIVTDSYFKNWIKETQRLVQGCNTPHPMAL